MGLQERLTQFSENPRNITTISNSNDNTELVKDSHSIKLVGLRQRAEALVTENQSSKPQGLLQRAEKLRSEIENVLGLRARAEQLQQQNNAKINTDNFHPHTKKSPESTEKSVPKKSFKSKLIQNDAFDGLLNKIDTYKLIFEHIKELQKSENLDSFWNTLLYAITGDLGAEKILILSPDRNKNEPYFYPIKFLGIEAQSSWSLNEGDGLLALLLSHDASILHADEVQEEHLRDNEREMLHSIDFSLGLLIGTKEEPAAVILIGKSILETPYTDNDVDFLTLLIELSTNIHDNLKKKNSLSNDESNEANNKTLSATALPEDRRKAILQSNNYEDIFHFAKRAASTNHIHDLYSLIQKYLANNLHVSSYSLTLFIPEQKRYRITDCRGLNKIVYETFNMPKKAKLISDISNYTHLYYISEFKTDPELIYHYGQEALDSMQRYWILPLIYKNFLIGFITIHDIDALTWTKIDQELALSMAEIVTPCLANFTLESSKELLLNNPTESLSNCLENEINLLSKQNAYASLIALNITNFSQIQAQLSAKEQNILIEQIRKTISRNLSYKENLIVIQEDRFAIMLSNKNQQLSQQWIKNTLRDLPNKTPVRTKIHYKHFQLSITKKDTPEEILKSMNEAWGVVV